MSATLSVPLNAFGEYQAIFNIEPEHLAQSPLPVPNSTKSFWFTDPDVSPSPKHGSEGPLTEDADICIIGSGITGVSAAYHLAKAFSEGDAAKGLDRPVKAVILEAREFCSGATGRNGGHLTSHVFFEFHHQQSSYGTEEALRSYRIEEYVVNEVKALLDQENKLDYVDFVPGGRLCLAFTERELLEAKTDFTAAKEAGVDVSNVTWFSKEETQQKYGAPYPSVLTPGNNLWPLKLVSVLYNLANKIGAGNQSSAPAFTVDLHTETPVTSISSLPQTNNSSELFPRRHSVVTPRGNISCSYVLHATNAYASHLLPHFTGPDGIVPTRGQIIATRANVTEDILTKTGGVGNDGFEYWFPRPLKEPQEYPLVIIGGGREITKSERFELYQTDDSVVDEQVGKALRAFLPTVYPGKFEAGKEPEMEWTGIMGFTKSGDPFVGPVIDPTNPDSSVYRGQYISAGYSGHGMPRAYACAEAVAKMIVADVRKEKWEPPEWLPRSYLTIGNTSTSS
ncbi:hypothetical protein QCA50_011178 [Cerrena zonata]|uniref:FAD dependent oxidoreductase domain-containing protein n=1 Tax=Cerrena zonata TaxID=2478898 RepID=A0AAW0G2U9_9APHY